MDKPTLTGEMLTLRPVVAADVDAVLDLVNDPEGRRLTGMPRTYTRAQVRRWVARVGGLDDRIDLAVTVHGNEEYLGEIALTRIDRDLGSARLRLTMRPAYRSRGYGTEAIELVLGLAFDGLGLHRVWAEVGVHNARAVSVHENLGFRTEGRLRDAYRDGDGWCDALVLGLLVDEFRASQGV